MFETKFTQKFGIKYPIMQGSIGWLSKAELVAAVSNAGGLGSLAMAGLAGAEELRKEIRKTQSLTKKPFAVNLPLLPGARAMSHEQMVDIMVSEHVTIVETIAAGLIPDKLFRMLKDNNIRIIHKCSKVKHAKSAQYQGVDAIALLGYGSDGHPGLDEISHLVNTPKASEVLEIPFLLAGSVADARGFVAALALGADGVLMGTRFLLAEECGIHANIRNWLCGVDETATVMVDITHGIPARRIKNKPAMEALALEKSGASLDEILKVLSGAKAYKAMTEGDIEGGTFGCGQVVGLIREVLPAKTIIDNIISQSQTIIGRLDKLAAKKAK